MNFFVAVVTMSGALAISSVFGHVFFLLPFEGPSTIGPILGSSVVDVVFSNTAPTQWSWSTERQPPSLVSSSYVFVSIVTVVSFYLTGRQLPVKRNADVLERTGTRQQKMSQDEPKKPYGQICRPCWILWQLPSVRSQQPWRNTPRCLVNEMELLAPRTAEESFSAKRALFLGSRWGKVFFMSTQRRSAKNLCFFFVSRGSFSRRGTPPVQNLGIGGDPWFFLLGYSRDRVEFSRLIFFFIRRFFAWINQAPRFRSPSKPHRCVILPPLQVVPVENEAESQGTQQHHCSWSKHKTGSVSTVAPFFLLMAIYNSPCETTRMSCRCDWVLGTLKSLGDSI